MTQLSKSAIVTKFNDASTGIFKTGQSRGIGSDDMRTLITDLTDSLFNIITDALPVSADTSGATITLNFSNNAAPTFFGSASFATAKAIAHSNDANGAKYSFHFQITDPDAKLTFPAAYIMSDVRWEAVNPQEWEPADIGKYKATATYDGTNWWLEISASPYV
jgi:hypothetical protein